MLRSSNKKLRVEAGRSVGWLLQDAGVDGGDLAQEIKGTVGDKDRGHFSHSMRVVTFFFFLVVVSNIYFSGYKSSA